MKIGLIITFIILVIVSLVVIFYHPIFHFFEKLFFKVKVNKKVYKIAKDYDFYLLNKVVIKVEGKLIHFDHLLFGNKYIYCIGKNYYSVGINGRFNDSSWFQYKGNNKFNIIKNPMRLHRERVNYFSSKLASSSDLFVATIIVNNSCYLEKIDGSDKYNVLLNLKNFEKMVIEYEKDKTINPIEPQRLQDLVLEIHQSNNN